MFYIDFYKETYIFFTTLIIFLPADRLARADRLAPAHRLAPTKCIRRDKPIVNLKTMDKSDIRPALILSIRQILKIIKAGYLCCAGYLDKNSINFFLITSLH